ncbi:MAG TPA: LacI family DNA-binding transcriptional regulator [Gaiellaceae bacterium]|nr:LacI family DNA-binding transcriptional regulator [Gaiellaceae bacterium]
MAQSRPTIREVASAAGVSIATVSRVLNGRPDVAPQTREAVLRAVRDRGFATNRSARALSGGRTGLVGFTLPIVHAAYFSSILSGAAEALYEQDMRLVLCPTLHEHEREVTLLDRLMHGTTDGAVLTLPEESNEELKALQRLGYPFVVVDPRVPLDEGIPAVSAAHGSGGRAATEHLLSLGHRRIAAITGPAGWMASTERLNGYRAALAAAGVMPDPVLVVESSFEIDGGERAAAELLALPDPPTAIFGFNDNIAIGAMRAARARGLRVPDDLSVVGFDDSEHAAIAVPALTTIRQPLAELGRMAVSLLLRLLEHQRVESLSVELATRLVVRESTAPVR